MGGIVIKKLYAYITGKSVRQRICICIVLTAMLTLIFFTVKVNFYDTPHIPQTSAAENAENDDGNETVENTSAGYEPPPFHISLVDSGILLVVIAVYSVHKIREKHKQRRL